MKKKVAKKKLSKTDKRLAGEEWKEITFTCPARGQVTEKVLVKVYRSGDVYIDETLEVAQPPTEDDVDTTYDY